MESICFDKRTHTCGEPRISNQGEKVTLNGWVQRKRNLGGLIFVDLRDRWGITQVVFDPQRNLSLFQKAENLKSEYVISVTGIVNPRPQGMANKKIPTGEIEVLAEKVQILSEAKTPPFVVADDVRADENTRLKYRYIDLRRRKMINNFVLRHRFTKAIRDFMDSKGFLEVETPMLIRSTPEGARDYLVPSRVQRGKFYALPQSPQILKQILMVSGFDRYFQMAKCFRDEDLRADRQPEFTQIDIEMSFVDQEDVLTLVEDMMNYAFSNVLEITLTTPFMRMKWKDAMERYGTDKPDLRFKKDIQIVDVTSLFENIPFEVLRKVVREGGVVKGIKLEGCAGFSRKQIDQISNFIKELGGKGVLPVAFKGDGIKSPLKKYMEEGSVERLKQSFNAKEGDLLCLLAGEKLQVLNMLGQLRLKMGKDLNLIDHSQNSFLWIVDFPLFKYNNEEGIIEIEHHPFTSPKEEDVSLLDSEPLKVRANAYDLIYNGSEVGSGSIRIHRRKLQEKVFEIIGISKEMAEERFGFLLSAFEYGVPPHGGIALGYDRIIAHICGEESIREVIVFPKNTSGQCPLTGAPVKVDEEQLSVLGIKLEETK